MKSFVRGRKGGLCFAGERTSGCVSEEQKFFRDTPNKIGHLGNTKSFCEIISQLFSLLWVLITDREGDEPVLGLVTQTLFIARQGVVASFGFL